MAKYTERLSNIIKKPITNQTMCKLLFTKLLKEISKYTNLYVHFCFLFLETFLFQNLSHRKLGSTIHFTSEFYNKRVQNRYQFNKFSYICICLFDIWLTHYPNP